MNYKDNKKLDKKKENRTNSLSKTECACPVVSKAFNYQSQCVPGPLTSKSDSKNQRVLPDLLSDN